MSRSVDGGDTWLDIPVSDHAFKPGDIGDYLSSIGITALGNKLFTTWFSTKSGSHKFWAASIVIDSTSSVSTISSEIPSEYKLSQNYPNPFNPSTKITFSLPTNDHVSLKVFDITGKEVAVLVNESLNPGLYEVRFDAENLPSGMYFYRLTSDNFSETKKMVVIK
ncbi:MAG: T9SS type A sorting domain-containing protein [Ignavibacteriae bacterium]|nr:T9SS type A sorting domain-containing protein [Ignavibacteriota bacterium]